MGELGFWSQGRSLSRLMVACQAACSEGRQGRLLPAAAWRSETSVLRTPVCQHREEPICHKPEHGIRPERTSVVGSNHRSLAADELFAKRAVLRQISPAP